MSLVPPSPTARTPPSHSAYLYLAQLTVSDPREALSYYQAAVDQLLILIKGKERIASGTSDPADPEPDSEAGLKRTAISALVAMVEIWMSSDLWFVYVFLISPGTDRAHLAKWFYASAWSPRRNKHATP